MNPAILLANARRELEAAREACPHWDYESDGSTAECCSRVTDAKRKLRRLRVKAP